MDRLAVVAAVVEVALAPIDSHSATGTRRTLGDAVMSDELLPTAGVVESLTDARDAQSLQCFARGDGITTIMSFLYDYDTTTYRTTFTTKATRTYDDTTRKHSLTLRSF